MTWLILATVGQFLNAIVAIFDKYIVSENGKEEPVLKPFIYAFYTCLLTGAWVLIYLLGFLPLPEAWHVPSFSNVEHPSLVVVALSLLAAYTFFFALVSMYGALRRADASDVMPVIGAVSAVATFGLSYYFLDGVLSQTFIFGILLLSLGTFLVSRTRFDYKIALVTIHSGLFFALHYIAMKGLFNETSFDNAFFWTRVAFVSFALSMLLVPSWLEKVRNQAASAGSSSRWLVILAKLVAGVAAFLILKATDWGDVAVVQALDGLKYAFIIVLSLFFSRFIPGIDDEVYDVKTVVRKIVYITLITLGFIILFM